MGSDEDMAVGFQPVLSSNGQRTVEPSAPWQAVVAEFTKAATEALEPQVRVLADDIYSRLLDSVQDYLCDNAQFNIASRLEGAERGRRAEWERAEAAVAENHHLRAALRTLASAVFGDQLGDEPNVYADYDALLDLNKQVSAALAPPPQGVNATGAEAFPDNHLNEGD